MASPGQAGDPLSPALSPLPAHCPFGRTLKPQKSFSRAPSRREDPTAWLDEGAADGVAASSSAGTGYRASCGASCTQGLGRCAARAAGLAKALLVRPLRHLRRSGSSASRSPAPAPHGSVGLVCVTPARGVRPPGCTLFNGPSVEVSAADFDSPAPTHIPKTPSSSIPFAPSRTISTAVSFGGRSTSSGGSDSECGSPNLTPALSTKTSSSSVCGGAGVGEVEAEEGCGEGDDLGRLLPAAGPFSSSSRFVSPVPVDGSGWQPARISGRLRGGGERDPLLAYENIRGLAQVLFSGSPWRCLPTSSEPCPR